MAKDKTTDVFKSTAQSWRTWHVIAYAAISVFGLTSGVVFYVSLSRSDFRCYQYKTVLMVHEFSRDSYEAQMTEDRADAWYKDEYCCEAFTYPLKLAVYCAVGTALSLVFGRGGIRTSGDDSVEYFSIDGQWQLVFWAGLFNGYHSFKSLVVALQFTDGYRKFMETIWRLPEDDPFRRKFGNSVQPFYIINIMLLWSLNVLCTLNFLLVIYRCGSGVDFNQNFDDDPEKVPSAEPAGPSDRPTRVAVLNENIGGNFRYRYYVVDRPAAD